MCNSCEDDLGNEDAQVNDCRFFPCFPFLTISEQGLASFKTLHRFFSWATTLPHASLFEPWSLLRARR